MDKLASQPAVSIVTPVYNGEAYLRECIESVLAQTCGNWEYVLLDNCSTDRTAEILRKYAATDSRIRVFSNDRFLGLVQNHNRALSLISPQSKYCKLLMADDFLFPECVAKMVELAETHPSVGLVCSYAHDGTKVVWGGMPYSGPVVAGREQARRLLMGSPYIFGSPTSQLMRADLIRRSVPFYDESNLHCDHAACYELLRDADFGFVHQVLSFNRVHVDSMTSSYSGRYNTIFLGNLTVLLKYGPIFLTPDEYRLRYSFLMNRYYRFLALSVLKLRRKDFWDIHLNWMRSAGQPLRPAKLAGAIVKRIGEFFVHPMELWAAIRTRRSQPDGPIEPGARQNESSALGSVPGKAHAR